MAKTRFVIVIMLLAFILVMTVLSGCLKFRDYSDPITENILISMNTGDYESFKKDFDDGMLAAFPQEKFSDFLSQTKGQFGDYRPDSKNFIRYYYVEGLTSITYNAEFSNAGWLEVRIVFRKVNEQMKVAGIWF